MQAGFVVIDKHRGGYVHGVNEHKSLFYAALTKAILHLRRDVDESNPRRRIKPKLFAIAFHGFSSLIRLLSNGMFCYLNEHPSENSSLAHGV
jgi:hypothetical protein